MELDCGIGSAVGSHGHAVGAGIGSAVGAGIKDGRRRRDPRAVGAEIGSAVGAGIGQRRRRRNRRAVGVGLGTDRRRRTVKCCTRGTGLTNPSAPRRGARRRRDRELPSAPGSGAPSAPGSGAPSAPIGADGMRAPSAPAIGARRAAPARAASVSAGTAMRVGAGDRQSPSALESGAAVGAGIGSAVGAGTGVARGAGIGGDVGAGIGTAWAHRSASVAPRPPRALGVENPSSPCSSVTNLPDSVHSISYAVSTRCTFRRRFGARAARPSSTQPSKSRQLLSAAVEAVVDGDRPGRLLTPAGYRRRATGLW